MPTGSGKLVKIAKTTALTLMFITLLVVAAASEGVGAMVCNLFASIAFGLATGTRVEGSPTY